MCYNVKRMCIKSSPQREGSDYRHLLNKTAFDTPLDIQRYSAGHITPLPLGEGRGGGATSFSFFFIFLIYVKNITKNAWIIVWKIVTLHAFSEFKHIKIVE